MRGFPQAKPLLLIASLALLAGELVHAVTCDFIVPATVGKTLKGDLEVDSSDCEAGLVAFYPLTSGMNLQVTGHYSFNPTTPGSRVFVWYAECVLNSDVQPCTIGTLTVTVVDTPAPPQLTTAAPRTTTVAPASTVAPTTLAPTAAPTTAVPLPPVTNVTTSAPTAAPTAVPTTTNASTVAPTTLAPSTAAPNTTAPSTLAPITPAPNTTAPATPAPTPAPTNATTAAPLTNTTAPATPAPTNATTAAPPSTNATRAPETMAPVNSTLAPPNTTAAPVVNTTAPAPGPNSTVAANTTTAPANTSLVPAPIVTNITVNTTAAPPNSTNATLVPATPLFNTTAPNATFAPNRTLAPNSTFANRTLAPNATVNATLAPNATLNATLAPNTTANLTTATPSTRVPFTPLPPIPPIASLGMATASPFIRCAGTCNSQSWISSPFTPDMWDTSYNGPRRLDGKAVDSVECTQVDGKLVVSAMSTIGNMAVRFPTFEVFSTAPQQGPLSSSSATAPQTAYGFDPTCLDRQPSAGIGDQVWWWDDITRLTTGSMNDLATSGFSYYQKFGGKHDFCNTFQTDPCRFSPLLTPRRASNSSEPQWTVNVNFCDVTWRGVLTVAAILKLRKSDGNVVFNRNGSGILSGIIFNEVVKPASWTQPSAGVLTNYSTTNIAVQADPLVQVFFTVMPTADVNGTALATATLKNVTADVQSFDFATANGTQSYWYNIGLYGLDYSSPQWQLVDVSLSDYSFDIDSCRGCSGTQAGCSFDDMQLAAAASNATVGTAGCPNAMLQFSLGPAATIECAPNSTSSQPSANGSKAFSMIGVVGVSDAFSSNGASCPSGFRNITIRFNAPGNATASELGPVARTFNTRLTFANGRVLLMTIRHTYYVSQVASVASDLARLGVCRSSPDFNLTALDAAVSGQQDLSSVNTTGLCLNYGDRRLAPAERMLLIVNLPGEAQGSILLSFGLTFVNTITGALVAPNPQADYQFRMIPSSMLPGSGVEFGFLFVPGAPFLTGQQDPLQVIIDCSFSIPNRGVYNITERVVVDPALKNRGDEIPTVAPPPSITGPFMTKVALAMALAVVIVGTVVLFCDKKARGNAGALFGVSGAPAKPAASAQASKRPAPSRPTQVAPQKKDPVPPRAAPVEAPKPKEAPAVPTTESAPIADTPKVAPSAAEVLPIKGEDRSESAPALQQVPAAPTPPIEPSKVAEEKAKEEPPKPAAPEQRTPTPPAEQKPVDAEPLVASVDVPSQGNDAPSSGVSDVPPPPPPPPPPAAGPAIDIDDEIPPEPASKPAHEADPLDPDGDNDDGDDDGSDGILVDRQTF